MVGRNDCYPPHLGSNPWSDMLFPLMGLYDALVVEPQYSENARLPHALSRILGRFSVDVASIDIQCHEPHVKIKIKLSLF
jgi:hypothetical protein